MKKLFATMDKDQKVNYIFHDDLDYRYVIKKWVRQYIHTMLFNFPTHKDLDIATMVHPPSVTSALKKDRREILQDEFLQATTFHPHDRVFHSDQNHRHFLQATGQL
jgi:transposase-like protein